MADTYLEVRESDGLCLNAIAYDGVSPYDPGEGMVLVKWDEQIRPWIGWCLVEGEWVAPEEPPAE